MPLVDEWIELKITKQFGKYREDACPAATVAAYRPPATSH